MGRFIPFLPLESVRMSEYQHLALRFWLSQRTSWQRRELWKVQRNAPAAYFCTGTFPRFRLKLAVEHRYVFTLTFFESLGLPDT